MNTHHEHHLLRIEDETGRRTVALEAATYSIGRDVTNAIVIHGHGVSRQHALLLRIPSPDGYRYRVVDGNADGKPSANGILVNGQRVQRHELKDGDEINFGGSVKAHYSIMSMGDAEFIKYLQSVNYHSIKAVPLTSTITQAEEELSQQQPPHETQLNLPPPKPAVVSPEPVPGAKSSPPLLLIIGGIVTILLVAGVGVVMLNRSPEPQPQPPAQMP
ncbi:FHA domain-containing protein [uncultured Thermosynechococcus sp.]|uniref:FHA domain-containing protein n=1 Tax=uncultured Thermosynechococcus sp. TaxID=436945 RepID=UPI00260BFF4F|nr:FHA domain-containing protein [uncultured Thermosynechococcus sp.]